MADVTAAPTLLALRNLRKTFGSFVVTDDVSLDVKRGALHALIGPNGAGKTTLIHQIAGTLTPDSGHVILNGDDVTAIPVHLRVRKGLARSFQITSILPAFSVLENVALAAQARDGSSFRFFKAAASEHTLNDAAMVALEEVGLHHRAAMRAGLLSHGEKRLLELALAIATQPQCLVLDEPLAGLGHDESEKAITMLAGLKRRYTIVLVEHDMDAVFSLADQVSVLVYGRVIATGTPADIQRNDEVRKAYLGDEEMV